MICPLCATTVPLQQRDCPACGVALAEYAAVWYLPDQLFNEGVVDLRRGDYGRAATHFARVCWFRADDVAAHRAWAHACTQLGRHDEAAGILLDAMRLAPSPDLDEQYAEALAASDREGTAGQVIKSKPAARANIRRKKSRSSRRRRR